MRNATAIWKNLLILPFVCFAVLGSAALAAAPELCHTLQSWDKNKQEKGNPDFYASQVKIIHQWLTKSPHDARLWALLAVSYEAHGHNYSRKAAFDALSLHADGQSDAAEIVMQEAEKFEKGRQSAALAAAQNAIRHDEKLAAAYLVKGGIYSKQENFHGAEKALTTGMRYAQSPMMKILNGFALNQVREKLGKDTTDLAAALMQGIIEAGGIEKMQEFSFLSALFSECIR